MEHFVVMVFETAMYAIRAGIGLGMAFAIIGICGYFGIPHDIKTAMIGGIVGGLALGALMGGAK